MREDLGSCLTNHVYVGLYDFECIALLRCLDYVYLPSDVVQVVA